MEDIRRLLGFIIFISLAQGVRCEDKALLGLIVAGVVTGILLMVFLTLILILPLLENAKEDPWKNRRNPKPPQYQRTDRIRSQSPKNIVELAPIAPTSHDKHLLPENGYPSRILVPDEQTEHEFFFNQGFANDFPYSRMVDPNPRVPVDPYSTVVVTEVDDDRASRQSVSYRQAGTQYQDTLPKDREDGMRMSATNLSNAAGDRLPRDELNGAPAAKQEVDEKVTQF